MIEAINPVILFRRDEFFKQLESDELNDLVDGAQTALDRVATKLNTGQFVFVDYGLLFFQKEAAERERQWISDRFELTNDIESVIRNFQRAYTDFLEKVRYYYRANPGSLHFQSLITGFRDSISHEIEVRDL